MNIGIVIHAPELIESLQVKTVLELLSGENRIHAYLCGTLGKAAVLDAGLEDLIDINQSLKPSACIEALFRTNDLVCLLNHGKELKSGRAFGRIVVSHLLDPEKKPLIQIERPGCPDGEIIPWTGAAAFHAEKFSGLLGLKVSSPPHPLKDIEITGEGQHVLRKISGASPGEPIMVNGIVVGKVISSKLSIHSEKGFITSIEGAVLKKEGLEKLHRYEERIPVDLAHAWVKTGALHLNSRSDKLPCTVGRRTPGRLFRNKREAEKSRDARYKVALIDHCAERAFELIEGADFAITVGDDTTEIAGDLLFRVAIPILGVTDGDSDGLLSSATFYRSSVVLHLKPGSDDLLGQKIRCKLFSGKESAFFESLEGLKKAIIKLAGNSLESISEY